MITPELQQLITERLAELPDYLQDAFATFDWVKIIEEIGIKHRLTPEQTNVLVAETALILLEVENPELFAVNLKNHIGIGEGLIQSIIEDLMERVFSRLQTELTHIVGTTPDVLRQRLQELEGVTTESTEGEPTSQPQTTKQPLITNTIPTTTTPNTIPTTTSPDSYNSDPYQESIV